MYNFAICCGRCGSDRTKLEACLLDESVFYSSLILKRSLQSFWTFFFYLATWINYYCRSISLNIHLNHGRNDRYSDSHAHTSYTYLAIPYRAQYTHMPAHGQAYHLRNQGSEAQGRYWAKNLFICPVGLTKPQSWPDRELPVEVKWILHLSECLRGLRSAALHPWADPIWVLLTPPAHGHPALQRFSHMRQEVLGSLVHVGGAPKPHNCLVP